MGWGDEVMCTGQARVAQLTDPRKVRLVFERTRWHEAWDRNPRIARPDEQGDFQSVVCRVDSLRPYMAAKSPRQWTWKSWGPPAGELYFSDEELFFGERYKDRLVVEPHIKPGAPINKDWAWERWVPFARMVARRFQTRLTQLGPPGTRPLPGVEFIATPQMRLAAAVLARAKAAVLPEGAMHHVCAAVNVPAVVIFGGYIAPAVTGYASQTSLFVNADGYGLGCGYRQPCKHCAKCMAAIAPEQVLEALEKTLNVPASERLAS